MPQFSHIALKREKNKPMTLRFNPLQVFKSSKTPAGLYARQKWLGESGTRQWKNVFRAMVVHPMYSKDPATSIFVKYLADGQTELGDWGDGLPFYQVLNALAHLDFPLAETQTEKAFERLYETQNADGTWDVTEPEWNTFLSVHALKNKGLF